MLTGALVLFALTACGGLYLAYNHVILKVRPPIAIALLHGAAAATALTMVLIELYQMESQPMLLLASVSCFAVAALGGLLMFSYRRSKSRPPLVLILAHVLAAAAGVFCLALWQFQ